MNPGVGATFPHLSEATYMGLPSKEPLMQFNPKHIGHKLENKFGFARTFDHLRSNTAKRKVAMLSRDRPEKQ